MKKLLTLFSLLLLPSLAFGWTSETGGGVVSQNSSVVLTSIESTQVLQSDTLTNLYGVTILGGSVNYASFNSGGILNFRNVTSSRDVVLLKNDQYLAWLTSAGNYARLGVSADDTLVFPSGIILPSASAVTLAVSGVLRSSGDADFVKLSTDTAHIRTLLRVSGDLSAIRASLDTALSTNNLYASGDTVLTRVSGTNVYIASLLQSSGDTSLVKASSNTLSVPTTLRASGDAYFVRVSTQSAVVSGRLSTSSDVAIGGNLLDSGGKTALGLPAAANAVNYVTTMNTATNVGPRVVVSGSDANIPLILGSKGTGIVSFANAKIDNVVGLVDGANIATDASLGNHFRVVLGGARALSKPTNATFGQKAIWEIIQDGTGGRTLSFDVGFVFGTDVTRPTLSTVGGKRDFVAAKYNGVSWDVLAVSKGYDKQ